MTNEEKIAVLREKFRNQFFETDLNDTEGRFLSLKYSADAHMIEDFWLLQMGLLKKGPEKCESCLAGFSKEDMLGNCTC